MKKNNLLIATALLSTLFALSACNAGGGGSGGTNLSNFTLACNPGSNANVPYGESYTITATLPNVSTATITIGAPGTVQQSANSCQITNGTSCNISVQNINTSGSTELSNTAMANTSGYTVSTCGTPNLLSQ